MPKPRPQIPPLPLLNGYAAAVSSSSNQLNQRRQQLATSRSSGAISCSKSAVPLAQVNTTMRRYSAAANPTEYLMDTKNMNLSTGTVFNQPPYPTSNMVQLPYNGDAKNECDASKVDMREHLSSGTAHNCQMNLSDACSSATFQVGMKEVPSWLKALRLHKYTQLFQQMSYAEMMGMDDQQLEHRQVTKGARKKILQSIQKLRERVSLLKQLETCIDENGDTRCLIFELRAMMSTPIWCTTNDNEENLPQHICRILQRLHNHLFNVKSGLPVLPHTNSSVPHSPLIQTVSPELSGLEDEYVVKLIQTYDKVINHEVFTSTQKQVIGQQRRALRLYAQQQCIQYSNLQFRNFSSTSSHPTTTNKPASYGRVGEWMVQPPYRSPVMPSSMSEHHQHRHSLLHTPSQNTPPSAIFPPRMTATGLNTNSISNTSHTRFAGLEGAETGGQLTEMEHRNGMYTGKMNIKPHQQPPENQPARQFWPMERPPPQVQAMTSAAAKPPIHACFSQQPLPVKSWAERTANAFGDEKGSSTGCWADLHEKKRMEEQGWSDVEAKEQGPNQLSYPQLLLSMLSSMPEFRELLEKRIYTKNNITKKAAMQTAATQTGHESRFPETALKNSTVTDRPLTAEEKLEFVNEFFLQHSPENEIQAHNIPWWQAPYNETLAKQLANLQLAKEQQEVKPKPVIADIFTSAFDAWTPLVANTAPVEPICEPIQPVKTSFQSSCALPQPSLSLSNISSGYSSSTCSETERASSPGLMVYNFNDCSKCSSKLCDSELPSICPSFEKCTKETVVKEETLSGLSNLPKRCESRDSAIGWYHQLSPSASFNCTNEKTKIQQPLFAYTSPPPTLLFSQTVNNQYHQNLANVMDEPEDWRQQHTNRNPIYEQHTMWYEDPAQRLTNHSSSAFHQTNNSTTQQQLSTHLWSAAPEMRAVH